MAGWLRGTLIAAALVLAVSLGAVIEVGAWSAGAFGLALVWNAWVLVAFLLVIRLARSLEEQGTSAGWSWAVALSALIALGLTTEAFVGLLA